MEANNERTFAGIPKEYGAYDNAHVVLIPVPFDGTSTWIKGADKGPEAFLKAAENMELYDIETDSQVYKKGINLHKPLAAEGNAEAMVNMVHDAVKAQLIRNKFVTLIGGEHSISIGSIRAFNEVFPNLTIVQLDAHADLRKEYDGSAYNHACALYEANETNNLVQIGIRSMAHVEKSVANWDNVFLASVINSSTTWMEDAIDLMSDQVYLTLDLDVFDPSILSSTGTPEPGGLLWYETLEFLRKLFTEKEVVGFDIVELCPNPVDKSSDFLAAKLYYKLLSYKYETNLEFSEEEIDESRHRETFTNLALDTSDYEEYDDH